MKRMNNFCVLGPLLLSCCVLSSRLCEAALRNVFLFNWLFFCSETQVSELKPAVGIEGSQEGTSWLYRMSFKIHSP